MAKWMFMKITKKDDCALMINLRLNVSSSDYRPEFIIQAGLLLYKWKESKTRAGSISWSGINSGKLFFQTLFVF